MKKIVVLLILVLCFAWLCPGVSAQSGIRSYSTQCTVSNHGDCTVQITVSLSFEQAQPDPVLPVPAEATDITLNGQRAAVSAGQGTKLISLQPLTGGNPGEFTFTVNYRLPGVVSSGKEGLTLTLPLLSGFAYPVEQTSFSILLPSQIDTDPVFVSSYYQELIAAQMKFSVSGNTITGSCGNLKDHETLTMVMPVTDAMFPETAVTARVMGVMDLVMIGLAVLALIYYVVFMCPRILHRGTRVTAPDGISAGNLQLWLTGSGVDFSLLVVTWAQLGYLRIQLDDGGRVLLHKRMEMGNERSSFENRCFRSLFGRRRIVDGTGYHYASLCRSMWSQTPNIREVYRPRSGNPKLFRGICTLSGIISGVVLAGAFTPHSLFLKILLALVTGVFSMAIQAAGAALPRRQRLWTAVGGGCAGVWLLLGILSGMSTGSALMILFQLLAGLGSVYGGKRTLLGHQTMEQIFALRRHLRTASGEELQRLMAGNENYFFDLAPYALALNADKTFARRFGRKSLQECNYLIVGSRRQRSATEWAKLLRTTVQILDAKALRLPLERFTGR